MAGFLLPKPVVCRAASQHGRNDPPWTPEGARQRRRTTVSGGSKGRFNSRLLCGSWGRGVCTLSRCQAQFCRGTRSCGGLCGDPGWGSRPREPGSAARWWAQGGSLAQLCSLFLGTVCPHQVICHGADVPDGSTRDSASGECSPRKNGRASPAEATSLFSRALNFSRPYSSARLDVISGIAPRHRISKPLEM